MTSNLPSGEGTPGGAESEGAFEPDSASAAELDPNTAPDAADEREDSSAASRSAATDLPADGTPESGDEPGRPLLGDPALDNEQEMQQARADLQSSREKSSTARDISDQLTAATRPETAERDRS
jgi:hypothetical protein